MKAMLRNAGKFCLLCLLWPLGSQANAQGSEASLAAYYPLDGNAQDSSGNQLHGAVTGATPTSDRFGRTNAALSFNGTTDFINCGNSSAFNFRSNFTVTAWVKLAGHQPAKYIVAKYFDGGGGNRSLHSWGMATDNSSRPYGFVLGDGPGYIEASGTASLNNGRWHAVGLVYDRAVGFRLYADGVLVNSRAAAGMAPWENAVPLTIGGGGTASGQKFGGAIDDVAIYNRALSTAEMQSLYRKDLSDNIVVKPAVKLEISAIVGVAYQLETSADLQMWSPVGEPFTATVASFSQFVEASSFGQYFRLTPIL
jgi:Concanavalin A-like lectin/glucanases superfamily